MLLLTLFALVSASCLPPDYRRALAMDYAEEGEVEVIDELDVRGIDGLVYPDVSKSGYPTDAFDGLSTPPAGGTIIHVPPSSNFTEVMRDALEVAASTAEWTVIELEAGVYTLKEPLNVRGSNVVVRGAGREATRVNVSLEMSAHEVRVRVPRDGVLYRWGSLGALVTPTALKRVVLTVTSDTDEDEFYLANYTDGSSKDPSQWCALGVDSGCEPALGNTQYAFTNGFAGTGWGVMQKYEGKTITVQFSALWFDGVETAASAQVLVDGAWRTDSMDTRMLHGGSLGAALSVTGSLWAYCCIHKLTLYNAVARGARELVVASRVGAEASPDVWFVGRLFEVSCVLGDAWLNATNENEVGMHAFARLVSMRGATPEERAEALVPPEREYAYVLEMDTPLPFRIFARAEQWTECAASPEIAGTRNVVLRDFTLDFVEHSAGPWAQYKVHAMSIVRVDRFLVENVHVRHAGNWPLFIGTSYEGTVRNAYFEEGYFPHTGSSNYVGGLGNSHRIVFYNVTGEQLRHVDFQSRSSHSVMTRSTFYGCDLQSHQGWSTNNVWDANVDFTDPGALWYNDRVNWSASSGPYWGGLWLETGTLGGHSPGGGPRWTVYGNRAYGSRQALNLGGQNERHLIVGNRLVVWQTSHNDWFTVNKAPVVIHEQSFDHVFERNVVLCANTSPNIDAMMRFLGDEQCNVSVKNNVFGHNGMATAGAGYTGEAALASKPSAVSDVNNTRTWFDALMASPVLHWPSLYDAQRGLPGASIVEPRDDATAHCSRGERREVRIRAHAIGERQVERVEVLSNWSTLIDWHVCAERRATQVPETDGVIELSAMIECETAEQAAAAEASGHFSTVYEWRVRVTDTSGQTNWGVWTVPVVVFAERFHVQRRTLAKLGTWLRADARHVTLSDEATPRVLEWRDRWHHVLRDHRDVRLVPASDGVSPVYVLNESTLNGRPAIRFERDVKDVLEAAADAKPLRGAKQFLTPWSSLTPQSLFLVFRYDEQELAHEVWSSTTYAISFGDITFMDCLACVRMRASDVSVKSTDGVTPNTTTIVFNRNSRLEAGVSHRHTAYVSSSGAPIINVTRADDGYFVDNLEMRVGGNFDGRDLNGLVAEVLFFRWSLDDDEREEVHRYLERYYGVGDAPPLPPPPPPAVRLAVNDTSEMLIDVLYPLDFVPSSTSTLCNETSSNGTDVNADSPSATESKDDDLAIDSDILLVAVIALAICLCVCLFIVAYIALRRRRRRRGGGGHNASRRNNDNSRSSRRSMSRRSRYSSTINRTSRTSSHLSDVYQARPAMIENWKMADR